MASALTVTQSARRFVVVVVVKSYEVNPRLLSAVISCYQSRHCAATSHRVLLVSTQLDSYLTDYWGIHEVITAYFTL